jgi:hypothetical protein
VCLILCDAVAVVEFEPERIAERRGALLAAGRKILCRCRDILGSSSPGPLHFREICATHWVSTIAGSAIQYDGFRIVLGPTFPDGPQITQEIAITCNSEIAAGLTERRSLLIQLVHMEYACYASTRNSSASFTSLPVELRRSRAILPNALP